MAGGVAGGLPTAARVLAHDENDAADVLLAVAALRGTVLSGVVLARPTSLTPAVQKVIVDAIEAGNYRETAAALAGIHRNTIRNWLVRGESEESGQYHEFLCAIEKAEATAEAKLLEEIKTAQPSIPGEGGRGADLWQTKAWIMERRWPKRWAARVRVAVSEELDALTEKLRAKLDAETFAKVVDATREEAASGAATPTAH